MATARIALTSTGDIDLSTGKMRLESSAATNIAAKVRKVLLLFQASWFLATTDGIPWIQQILAKKNPDLRVIENILRTAITGIPEITNISSFQTVFDRIGRTLTVTTALNTPSGATVITTPLVLP